MIHLGAVGDAEPAIVGPLEAAVLVAATVLFAGLTRLSPTTLCEETR